MSFTTSLSTAQESAVQKYEGARHLLNVTFPMVKDPKLLLGVIDNMFSSLSYSMDAILAYERTLRLVPIYSNNFQSKFNLFRFKSVRRNKISPDIVNLIVDLREILELHKKSPMEFQRGNRFIICNKDYQFKAISIKELQRYLRLTKEMVDLMQRTVNHYNPNKNI